MKFNNPVGRRPKDFDDPTSAIKWIQRVYEANKGMIDEKMPHPPLYKGTIKELFQRQVTSLMKAQDMGVLEALDHLVKTEQFTSKGERYHTSAVKSLKETYVTEGKFLASTTGGRLRPELLRYSGTPNSYIYNDKWMITYQNSPLLPIITKL